MENNLLDWTTIQGQILTGDGNLTKFSSPEKDFTESNLPHYLLRSRSSRSTFLSWIKQNKRSDLIVGSWFRPLFSGGWKESTSHDTEAFNLQTPSIFIDMRFPKQRPPHLRNLTLQTCSSLDLRFLARQHCFAGYTFPEDTPNLFTRHHVIDWNYHPRFPRNRPNRWFVEMSPDGDSFKEYSFVRDNLDIPVYFERWQRFPDEQLNPHLPPHTPGQPRKYLACRRITDCPSEALAQGRIPQRDAILVIVGNHFAFAEDRQLPFPQFESYSRESANPGLLVDHTLDPSINSRSDAEKLLDLFGVFGKISSMNCGESAKSWTIIRSTHPWKEGTQFLQPSNFKILEENERMTQIEFNGAKWKILESSFTRRELEMLFRLHSIKVRSHL